MGTFFLNLLGGFGSGIGQSIGKVAGKAADWIPGPAQYRRNKIHALTAQMLALQNHDPFDAVKYDQLRTQRDKLELEAENAGQ